MIRPLLVLLTLLTASPALQAQEAPQRIASLNLCTDLLLLRLADRERIVSLSYLAAEPRWSPLADRAEGLRLNHGQAEEILAVEPDLILNSRFSATPAVNLLRRLGHEVQVLDFPTTVDEAVVQIREVARLIGHEPRGEALIDNMQARIADVRQRLAMTRFRTLFLASNGISFGTGTLRHEFISSLGWENVAATLGLQGVGMLDLERIVAADPDFILIGREAGEDAPLAHHLLRHPALARLRAEGRYLHLPDALFECAGPSVAVAYERLARQLPPEAPR